MDVDSHIVILRKSLDAFPFIKLAILYGSATTGRLRTTSDFDVAVAMKKKLTLDQRMDICLALEEATRRTVDLLDLQVVSGVILHQALTTGRLILVRDHELYADIMKRMLFNQADMMPYYHRMLTERREGFLMT